MTSLARTARGAQKNSLFKRRMSLAPRSVDGGTADHLHHAHLTRAAASIGIALKEAGGGLNIDAILIPLRAGYTELERAADALPGFEKIAYRRACCVGARIQ